MSSRRQGRRQSGPPPRRRPQGSNRRDAGGSFWGDPAALPDATRGVRITSDPSAVARSLGPPPLPGHEAIAAHYFAAVYDRTVALAGAIAAAGGLIALEELQEQVED